MRNLTYNRFMRFSEGLFICTASVALPFLGAGPVPKRAIAADQSQFNAGYFISDSFFDGNAMPSQQVQVFLNSKVPNYSSNN